MAQEQILTVSLKEYKKGIDDLRASLLGLNEESDEYKKIVNEIKTRQDKLNDVMKVGKKDTDSADGSYNKLVQTMAELKKQWRATADEVERAQLGEKILEVNDKLKELDASTGNFQRNVGNYSASFQEAFNAMGISGGKTFNSLVKGFGAFTGSAKGATTATGGLTTALNVLKAHPIIAVIAVVIVLFLKIKEAIEMNEEASNKWAKAMSAFQPVVDAFNRVMGFLVNLVTDFVLWCANKIPPVLKAIMGALSKVLEHIEIGMKVIATVQGMIGAVADWIIDKIKWVVSGIVGLVGKVVKVFNKDLGNQILNFKNTIDNFTTDISGAMSGFYNTIAENVGKASKAVKEFGNSWAKETKDAMKRQEDWNQLQKDTREQEVKDAQSRMKQAELEEKMNKASGEEKMKYAKLLQEEIDRNGAERLRLAKEELRLAKEKAELAPNSKEDNDRLAELEANVINTEASIIEAKRKTTKIIKGLEDKADADTDNKNKQRLDKNKKFNEQLAKDAYESYDKTLKHLNTNKDRDLKLLDDQEKLLKEQGKLTAKEQQRIEDERHKIIEDSNKEILKTYEKMAEDDFLTKEMRDNANEQLGQVRFDLIAETNRHQIAEEKNKNTELQELYKQEEEDFKKHQQTLIDAETNRYTEVKKSIIDRYANGDIDSETFNQQLEDAEQEHQNRLTDINIQGSKEREEILEREIQKATELFGPNSSEVLSLQEQYEKQKTQTAEEETNKRIALMEEETKKQKKELEDRKKSTEKFKDGTQKLLKGVTDAWKANLDQRVKMGELSDKEAEDEFERIKAIQVGEAIMSTIEGAIGAYKNDVAFYKPTAVGMAIGAIDAGAVLASGYAQVKAIQNQSYGNSNEGALSSGGIQAVAATPLLDQNRDTLEMTNLSEIKESDRPTNMRVWVSATDITDTQNSIKTSVEESTF